MPYRIAISNRIAIFATVLFTLPLLHAAANGQQEKIDFNRDIRPIFAAKCFACHGPDENHREAGLRLDVRQDAVDLGAIAPGSPAASELITRIQSKDPDLQMPPPHLNDGLSPEQKKKFEQWIAQGAQYAQHWSLVPPQRPSMPPVSDASWPINEIDRLVLAQLDLQQLKPSPKADRYTLIRRLYLDLIGLPPTPQQADAFVSDAAPDAYEKVVDQLLASPRYGERWARPWLDLARYSDTNGYEKDRPRSIWPYRDWVIKALNADMPYDQFSIEQLAGDMLPDATQDQKIATGFHRNTMLNEEGGIDPLEYRFYSVVDRVATTGTVWLGLSIGCAQCHTHKYDPITHTDYYRMFALLNNAEEPDLEIQTESNQQKQRELNRQISQLQQDLHRQFPMPAGDGDTPEADPAEHLQQKFEAWKKQARQRVRAWRTITPQKMETNLPRLEILDDGSLFSTGDVTKRDVFRLQFPLASDRLPISAIRIVALPDSRLPAGGPGRAYYEGRKGSYFLSELSLMLDGSPIAWPEEAPIAKGNDEKPAKPTPAQQVRDGNGSSGWSGVPGKSPQRLTVDLPEKLEAGKTLELEMLFERHFVASLGRFRVDVTSDPAPDQEASFPDAIEALLTQSPALEPQEKTELLDYFLSVAPELAEARKPIEQLQRKLPRPPITLIMQERPEDHQRASFRHHRGEYLSPKEAVEPGLPSILLGDSESGPSNRLEMARWLVSRDNPLAARVAANRAWQAFFGRGLQQQVDEFGTQSSPPSHPALLDWLACELMDHDWSMKRLHRKIVTSATYRQASKLSPELLAKDPENRWLARGPRFRLPAETIRDSMLAATGLLSETMFGPGVRPPQPASVTAIAYGSPKWNAATGENRYRRSIYTFHKRTAPFAAYATFDAPTGENCTAKRDRSNTPLQALTLLNDEMYFEMAKALAQRAIERHHQPRPTVEWIFRQILTRPCTPEEGDAILAFYQAQQTRLASGELSAEALGGDSSDHEKAAWTLVARAIMNLDEAINKP